MLIRKIQAMVLAGAIAILANGASATVTFSLMDADATPTSTTTAARLADIPVSFYLNSNSSSDVISGVDYKLQVSNNGSNYFTLVSRKSSGVFTPYPGTVAPTTFMPYNGSSTAAGAADLGGDRNGGADFVGTGNGTGPGINYLIDDFIIRDVANTPNGTYTFNFVPLFSTYTGPGLAYASYTPAFASFDIIITPEPASLGMISLAAMAALSRRRASRP